jgi:hypothetical protein
MLILRPLYEAWLLKATESPLAPWQRALLLRALKRDEALRCFALELAELNHADAPAALKAPDLRTRLHAALLETRSPQPVQGWQPHWSWAVAAVIALAVGAGLWWQGPAQQPTVEVAAVHQEGDVKALRLPSPTFTPTTVPSPQPTATPSATASPTPSPTAVH